MEKANGNGALKLNSKGKDIRNKMIAERAYYHAEQRGFQNGDPLLDWLAAEVEIDDKLAKILSFLDNRVAVC